MTASGRKLRLLLTADTVGGVWQYSLDLARALAAMEVEPLLALVGPAPTASQRRAAADLELVETGLPLDWVAGGSAEVLRSGEALSRLAGRSGADLVQLHSAALCAGTPFDVPVVAVAHSCISTWWAAVKGSGLDPGLGWRGRLAREGLEAADLVVAPSRAFAQATAEVHRLGRIPEAVHNGRRRLPFPEAAPHDFVLTAGRLWDEGKNLATLDQAAAAIAVPLYAAGPTVGPSGESIALRHACPLGTLAEDELSVWLARRPVFASAALYEPFGLAVLEAAQAGCPLLLSDIPTFRELWDGAATFLDPHDPAAYAAAIAEIVGDDFLRSEMGRAAKRRAARYTPEATARAMLGFYRRLVDSRAVDGARAAA